MKSERGRQGLCDYKARKELVHTACPCSEIWLSQKKSSWPWTTTSCRRIHLSKAKIKSSDNNETRGLRSIPPNPACDNLNTALPSPFINTQRPNSRDKIWKPLRFKQPWTKRKQSSRTQNSTGQPGRDVSRIGETEQESHQSRREGSPGLPMVGMVVTISPSFSL